MFSRARLLGHPIHPMIIPLPIGAFIFSTVSLILFALVGDAFWLQASYWLSIVGVVTGLAAAIPGLVDWSSIPGNVRAKQIATWHMVMNFSIVLLFFVSWILLGGWNGIRVGNLAAPLILQILGVAWLTVSGWLGWEMVYRHRVAVEPPAREERERTEEQERRRAA